MDAGVPVEKLRTYLRELNPEARALLLNALERNALQGTEIPGAELILQELRPSLREENSHAARIGNPARAFFRPLEPFLVDSGSPRLVPGRVERSSLQPLWDWIGRDLLSDSTAAYSRAVVEALLAGHERGVIRLARPLQDEAASAMAAWITQAAHDDRLRRRLIGQIGTPRALEDLRTLQRVLVHQDVLAQVSTRLPHSIKNLADEQLAQVLGLLEYATTGKPELLVPVLLLLVDRLAAPWQLVRVAVKSADSDVAARVAQAPYAVAVTMALAELRCRIEELRRFLKGGQLADATALLKHTHDAIRGLRTELDFTGEISWSKELATSRAAASELLHAEIEIVPGRVRRVLRPRATKEIEVGSELDPVEVAEVQGRIELVIACRKYAGELAINQIAPRVHSELQNYLDTGTAALLESLRTAGVGDRKFRQSQVDAAVRFAGTLFGPEYAGLLSKAAGMAAADRKLQKA
ncbi:MAG TPA: hypothetical protein VGD36_05610 [Xanthobacteraceae bacterium]|jgi:hypothetical protein